MATMRIPGERARVREREERERAPIKNDATINYFRARASEQRWRSRRDTAVRCSQHRHLINYFSMSPLLP